MQKISPFLWFDDQAEEAASFYTSLFNNSKVSAVTRYGPNMPGPEGQVMTVAFQLEGQEFTALNGGPEFQFTPAVSFFVHCDTPEEVDRLWAELSEGGNVLIELGQYPFSERYGWLADRYGVSWQLSVAQNPQKIVPTLMFVGEQFGKAEQAMKDYTSIFDDSRIEQIERYAQGEGDVEGAVKYARFTLEGQEFGALESSLDHRFTFTPATSFYVNCETQAEVDHLWEKLSEGGAQEPCGWLRDRYGVSWQIVPTALGEMLSDPDAEKANRVTQVMLQMTKLDIGVLQHAYQQG